MSLYPMKMTAPLKDYLWGGTKLKTDYGKKSDLPKIAESWEISCRSDGESIIANGIYRGQALKTWLESAGKQVLGSNAAAFPQFPLLVKLIDAEDNLSVQVHPDDTYARRVEGGNGKTEMWYVIDAAPGAMLIYGISRELSREEFRRHLENGTILDVCNQVPVKKGDVFFIPSGTLHSIGKGILLCEIQQNSNTTYRVYDYGRVGKDGRPRELHIEKAMDVVRLTPSARQQVYPARIRILADAGIDLLADCEYFTVYHINLHGSLRLTVREDSFQAMTALTGGAELVWGKERMPLAKGESVFLPAGLGDFVLQGRGEIILSMI